jgi:putative hemolysin
MREIPTPTFDLSPIALPRGLLHRFFQPSDVQNQPVPAINGRCGIEVAWAKHQDEVREAQRLRFDVFATEMGANLKTSLAKHDIDSFDNFCEHLIVRDIETKRVVGTYRALTPAQAKRIGRTYSDAEFDLANLQELRPHMVELGRSCVHIDYRQGGVIMALWGALAEFMERNQLHTMIGCASIPMLHNGIISGHAAASIWRQVKEKNLATVAHQVTPRLPLPIDELDDTLDIAPPALIKGYLRLGAKVLGAPAWDPDFNTADLPMMMQTSDTPDRDRKHFLGS